MCSENCLVYACITLIAVGEIFLAALSADATLLAVKIFFLNSLIIKNTALFTEVAGKLCVAALARFLNLKVTWELTYRLYQLAFIAFNLSHFFPIKLMLVERLHACSLLH